MQPEFLAALQILAALRRDFANRLVFYRTLEIEHGKVAHLQRALGHIHKISRLITQTFQRRLDFRLQNLCGR